MSSPDDYTDLRPEPMPAETCLHRGYIYRRHEVWDDGYPCTRCGRTIDEMEKHD